MIRRQRRLQASHLPFECHRVLRFGAQVQLEQHFANCATVRVVLYDQTIGLDEHWQGFDHVREIMQVHALYDVVVEMTVYNCAVGLWQDDYVCWELRTNY